MKNISPQEYAQLEGIKRLGWSPVYSGHKTIKERSYSKCDCCGAETYTGWIARQIPVGAPLHYTHHKPSMMEELTYEWQVYAHKRLMQTLNILTDEPITAKTITFTRYNNED